MLYSLINIGFGNSISTHRVIAVLVPNSAPIKRMVQEAKERKMLIDASFGRKVRSVIVMDNNHIIVSSVLPETITNRLNIKFSEVSEEKEEN